MDDVRSIQAGDRIAIKSSYTRKHDLPFDNRGNIVSVMAIKAIGTVTENPGDGRHLKVDWKPFDPPREWYFYTNQNTVWRVLPGEWTTDALIDFTFDGKPQDIHRFCNAPYWRERFSDGAVDEMHFKWARFYEALADKLLTFKDKREQLIREIHTIASGEDGFPNLQDHFKDGASGPLRDICPFTIFGFFNRGITEAKRKAIATRLAILLGVTESIPSSFEGIPVLNALKSWFFGNEKERQSDDIDVLWEVFNQAIRFSESDDPDVRTTFVTAFDNATQRYNVGWNLTMGLYWIRPWTFPTLDGQSRNYINNKLNIPIGLNGPKGRCNANDYLALSNILKARFEEEVYPVHSFPELSLSAWIYRDGKIPPPTIITDPDILIDEFDATPEEIITPPPIQPYSVDDIVTDGCFLTRSNIEKILQRLRTKKNLILQGPPGTGKSWLARRLGYALTGQRDDSKVRAVQFHPNLSYEDFVRGWRPAGEGRLTLVDGSFIEVVNAALTEPNFKYVVVIEEINRGNPAQIFGEMLTLLEADKRTPNEALELCYRRTDEERVYIPANLYIIGTMNIADRSLALVDLALRRRFAFIDLEPIFGDPWRDWVHNQCDIDTNILMDIETRILKLNNTISTDTSLGPQFRVGHSYVTPSCGETIDNIHDWFHEIVSTEIGPLLDEYWFDDLEKAQKAREQLLEGL